MARLLLWNHGSKDLRGSQRSFTKLVLDGCECAAGICAAIGGVMETRKRSQMVREIDL